jgi:poly(ADP-ribose) glycohydrolase ARH3
VNGTLADRLAGAMLGTALGDALGAPFEGMARPAPDAIAAHLAASTPLRWTDDTHMMLALAASLVATGGTVEPQQLGGTFARYFHDQPWRGYGAGPPQVFELASGGMSYEAAAASLFGGTGSFGNGAAMRCAPAVVLGFPDLAAAAELARAQARVTHAHPEGVDGAVVLACMLCVAASVPLADPWPAATLDGVAAQLATDVMRQRLRDAIDLATAPGVSGGLGNGLRTGVAAAESVPAAVAVFLAHRRSPIDTIRAAVELGGDTDTVAAMAGALVGAQCGLSGLPASLLDRLEARERIERAAQLLLGLRRQTPPS